MASHQGHVYTQYFLLQCWHWI
ncbi:hypothetical protein NC652_000694 [Populus alba x Populus x berolinensis]|uniref:Uncharacterized protein n=1 Tax=Populus alba x Populus x berolinensis TaxID=444605 RepID=A0AAD6WEP1_9ROSI|nr:hypothetical protein NC652_000694 [Populus alba x Populus x berolinensis]KAJ7010073.1 hypothetical protein NC653_000717 [Populus alba x Populus x berolinensis]